MRLSRRLETILSLVPTGSTAADIGTDHGLVPAELVGRGICSYVIASDLRKSPLNAARMLVKERGLADKIDLRLGDGLQTVAPGEAGTLILAGMGGALMQKILSEGEAVARAAKQLILSPQSEVPQFRRFLQENAYTVRSEQVVEEDGKFYFILDVIPEGGMVLSEAECEFGFRIPEENFPEHKLFLNKEQRKLELILRNIAENSAEPIRGLSG